MNNITYKDGTTYSIVKLDYDANGYLKSDLITLKNFYRISTFTTGESNIIIDKEAVEKFQNENNLIIRSDFGYSQSNITIKMERLYDYNDKWLEELLIISEGLQKLGYNHTTLILPFFPYARADRFMADRNGPQFLQLPNCDTMINILRHSFDRVYTYDLHNPDIFRGLGNWIVNDTGSIVNNILNFMKEKNEDKFCLIVPDKGARKRVIIQSLIENYKIPYIQMLKERTVNGGLSTRVECGGSRFDETCTRAIVVDDICDGGATFIETAKALKNIYEYKDLPLDLYVTHGIFSQGTEKLSKYYERIKSMFRK